MQKQNMNWFATVLSVVICFIILTDLTELSVEFCVDKVIKDRGGLDMRRRRRGKSSSLGMPEAPQVNIQGDSSFWAWGCPGRHPLFLQQVSVCFRIRFVHAICAILERLLHVVFIFLLCTMLVWDSTWLIYRTLIALHLNLLSMAL